MRYQETRGADVRSGGLTACRLAVDEKYPPGLDAARTPLNTALLNVLHGRVLLRGGR